MTDRTVLITGGAGFIGRQLARALVNRGFRARVLDNLEPQAHGGTPGALEVCDLLVGDVTDRAAVARSLGDVDAVVHFAALVGLGQSDVRGGQCIYHMQSK